MVEYIQRGPVKIKVDDIGGSNSRDVLGTQNCTITLEKDIEVHNSLRLPIDGYIKLISTYTFSFEIITDLIPTGKEVNEFFFINKNRNRELFNMEITATMKDYDAAGNLTETDVLVTLSECNISTLQISVEQGTMPTTITLNGTALGLDASTIVGY